MDEPGGLRTSPARRLARLGVFALAVVGALAGIGVLYLQLTGGALDDVRAYYEAGARLNAGQPLYPPYQDVNGPTAYFYPPLFAILFRPLSLLPYDTAAAIWEAIVIASFVATLWLVGIRRRETWLVVGILGVPIAWSLAIAQAQSVVTLLMAIGSPLGIAMAANLKLFPLLAGVWYVGRRDWSRLTRLVVWVAVLVVIQLLLEPRASLDYLVALQPRWLGQVRNLSPYAVSPILWAVLLVAGVLLTLRLAPTRWGWAAAVVLSVLAPPRLLLYMLMTLLAALRSPDGTRSAGGPTGEPTPPLGP